ncbi:MAG: bifunctional methylenetetrahydrofolate dehydrogenase/methenyltetrahydrofolate cyclohydrolase FolD [Clostridiales bacterium]|nr:bifunctional methylenetetrahydrofolate dehydrogenase/methenyltetrahydrofolate cyclohydrolase FolD [Clostridiales bacterium]
MTVIIDGKKISSEIRAEIAADVEKLKESGITPGLAVIIVGEDKASQIYVRNKGRACAEVGIYSEIIELPNDTSESELLTRIDALNARADINGILVQLPLPSHISEKAVTERILSSKDVDAFSYENTGMLACGSPRFLPCTPAGIMELLRRSDIDVCGKDCVVIGRSNIVGKPIAQLLLAANGTVTVCHSKTPDIKSHTKRADIIVCAVGKAGFLRGDMVKDGAVVIDVGINRDESGKLCGDVDFESVSAKASYNTPVPGGVGPMTITMLLENTVKAAKLSAGK